MSNKLYLLYYAQYRSLPDLEGVYTNFTLALEKLRKWYAKGLKDFYLEECMPNKKILENSVKYCKCENKIIKRSYCNYPFINFNPGSHHNLSAHLGSNYELYHIEPINKLFKKYKEFLHVALNFNLNKDVLYKILLIVIDDL